MLEQQTSPTVEKNGGNPDPVDKFANILMKQPGWGTQQLPLTTRTQSGSSIDLTAASTLTQARVAELADAQDLKSCVLTDVRVQVPPRVLLVCRDLGPGFSGDLKFQVQRFKKVVNGFEAL